MGEELHQSYRPRAESGHHRQQKRAFHQEERPSIVIQLSKEAIEEKIFNAGVIDPQNAINLGLIDGVRNIDQEISNPYPTKNSATRTCRLS